MSASLNDLFQRLTIEENRLTVLHEIKRTVYSVQLEELKLMVKNVSLEPVFSALGSSEREALEVGVDILSRLLDCLDPTVVLAQLRDELYMGMGHPHERIRQVCIHQLEDFLYQEAYCPVTLSIDQAHYQNLPFLLANSGIFGATEDQIERLVDDEVGLNNLKNDSEMLANVISTVADESLAVSKLSMKSLIAVGKDPAGASQLFEGPLQPQMIRVAATNETIRYRVFEIATSIAATSLPALEKVNRSGLLGQLLSDLHTEDDLVQLNAIEMLCALVDSPHGIVFLEKEGFLRKMEEMLVEAEADPSQGFLLPELVKFFGILSRHQPKELSEKYPAFLQCCFHLLESCETSLLNIAVETIGFVGSSTDGKRALNKQGTSMVGALSILGKLIQVPPIEVRVRALSALACLFSVQKEQLNDDLEGMLQQWFEQVSTKPMDLILSLCQQPFLEIRCPALSILQALCDHKWAQTQLLNRPGFQEYLLDRSTEHEKIGKESKYAVVKALAEAYHTGEIFGRPYLLKLREYVRDGPFYVQTQSEVVVEGSR